MANCWSLKIYVSTPLPGPELDHRHHRKWTRLGLIYILQLDAINYRTNDSTNSPVRLFRTYGKEIQQTISPLYCLEVNNEVVLDVQLKAGDIPTPENIPVLTVS
ncbi:hypothetical protein ABKN59_004059 [Abortiporus biennis]